MANNLRYKDDTHEYTFPLGKMLWQKGQLPFSIYDERKPTFAKIKNSLQSAVTNINTESFPIEKTISFDLKIYNEVYDNVHCIKLSWRTIAASQLNSEDLKHLSKEDKINMLRKTRLLFDYTFWVDPQKNCIVRKTTCLVTLVEKNKELMDAFQMPWESITENHIKKDEKSNLWYPYKWNYKQLRNGNTYETEFVTLDSCSWNQKIPNEILSFQIIKELQPGCPVKWETEKLPPPTDGDLIWEGNKIIGKNYQIITDTENQQKTHRHIFILLVNIILILAIIASIYFQRWYRQ
jgi:hypothetical protein